MAAGKAKFDQEAAFRSIIGVGTGAGEIENKSKPEKQAGRGRPPVERETKKRVTLALYPSVYGDLQKIAFVKRQSVSDIVSEMIANYVSANADYLDEYEKIKNQ